MMLLMTAALALAAQQIGTISPGGVEAIGPKQDDPRQCASEPGIKSPEISSGIIVQGGREAIGPKQDDPLSADGSAGPGQPGVLAIGPKQDDPSRPGALSRPGDDNDPKASGGSSIIVQGGLKPIVVQGGMEAIGPKQDDPRAVAALGVLARPGDDNDPKAGPALRC